MGKLLYVSEHLSCYNYSKGEDSAVDYFSYPANYQWGGMLNQCNIVFILEGSMYISYENYSDRYIPENKIFLLPPGCSYKARTEEHVSCLIFRIQESFQFCDRFSLEALQNEKLDGLMPGQDVLDIIPDMQSYISFFLKNLKNGLRCFHYLELKTKELFFLLRAYYPKPQLAAFCQSLMSKDVAFSEFVLKNYRKIKTVNEFASLASYSTSGFEKKFKQVFGSSAYQWMKQKKNQMLYHELNATDKPIKQVAEEQGFPSLPQFNDYCKKHFGYPPGKIRRMNNSA